MQWFTRRPGTTVVVGVDKALAMIRGCAGYFEGNQFVETWDKLEVEAVHDGATVTYNGDPTRILPVLRVRGRYCDIALLETPTLGILTRASRVQPRLPDFRRGRAASRCCSFPHALTRTKSRRRRIRPTTLRCSGSTPTLARKSAVHFDRRARRLWARRAGAPWRTPPSPASLATRRLSCWPLPPRAACHPRIALVDLTTIR